MKKTKHNVGFMVIDELAKKHQVTFKKNAFQALVGEYFEKWGKDSTREAANLYE